MLALSALAAVLIVLIVVVVIAIVVGYFLRKRRAGHVLIAKPKSARGSGGRSR